jgi:hypothetical protein
MDPYPWLHLEANSEQRQPVYTGATPREIALNLYPFEATEAKFPESLRVLGEKQLQEIRIALVESKSISKGQPFEVEGWPALDDRGRLTWAFARWRPGANHVWRWLGGERINKKIDPEDIEPRFLYPKYPKDFYLIFADALQMEGLYDKPLFGDCLWTNIMTDPFTASPIEGWVKTHLIDEYRKDPGILDRICLVLPQPARLNGKPITFIVQSTGTKFIWPSSIWWRQEGPNPNSIIEPAVIKTWPESFKSSYINDLLIFAGEKEATFPISGRCMTFVKKNNSDPDNQLNELVEYLEERYALLGLKTIRQSFLWRGNLHTNLIAVIPGADTSQSNRPVLLADHIDTAFCEDVFRETGIRVSAPGADDNASATATLLRAAEILKATQPFHEIWLVHLTGEEFPSDGLGARFMISQLLRDKKDITGLVLLDMIGYGETLFQVNPGNLSESLHMASVALDAAAVHAPQLTPLLVSRYDEQSYLYNTDGLIFSENGYPVILINEHLNYFFNLDREGYHDCTDTSSRINFDFAIGIAKIAIETVARLAGVDRVP